MYKKYLSAVAIIVIILVAFWAYNSNKYWNSGMLLQENMNNNNSYGNEGYANPTTDGNAVKGMNGRLPAMGNDKKDKKNVENFTISDIPSNIIGDIERGVDNVVKPRDQLSPDELLPKDFSSTWAQFNPVGGADLKGQNFLEAGSHMGINSVGQTLRNANLQLRSEPPNPQGVVSPWLNSTIEPDTERRYFEVGQC